MHKGRDLFKDNYYGINKINEIVGENRTVFLDIDGVIQPGTQKRFDHDNKKLKEYLYEKYNDSRYLDVKDYDIGAVYYDWRPTSVGILKEILDTTLSNIVLSSDWRDTKFEYLKAFFKIYDLEDYLIDVTNPNIFITKKEAIKSYLNKHPNIKKYIVLDDMNFYDDFGPNFRLVRNNYNSLIEEDLEYAKFLFNVQNNSYEKDKVYHFNTTEIEEHLFEIDGKKVLYLDNVYMDYRFVSNTIFDYMIADIFYNHKDVDLLLFKDELNLDLKVGYKDSQGIITVNRNINSGLFNDEISNIKYKVLKKVR